MNTLEKLLLTLTIATFSISNLYAQPCVGDNCIATIGKSKISSTKSKFVAFNKENNSENNNLEKEFVMIALDDNTESNSAETNEQEYSSEYIDGEIVLIDDSDNSDISFTDDIKKLKMAKILYACEDIINNIVACDNEKKEECECV